MCKNGYGTLVVSHPHATKESHGNNSNEIKELKVLVGKRKWKRR